MATTKMVWIGSTARLVAGALLFHFVHVACGSSLASKSGIEQHLSETAFSRRTDSTAKLKLGLHARARKAAGGARLRHASAFRASRAVSTHRTALRGGMTSHQAPLYIPKISLANVTQPTAFPPPPPVLNAWQDMQPIDTAVGYKIISGFIAPPTLTPPPTQASLDLAFACPVLLTWPKEVEVTVPDQCASLTSGNWTAKDSLLLNWETSCFEEKVATTTTPQLFTPITTYTLENGDLFGTSQMQPTSLFESEMVLRDCGGARVYSIEEKLYKQVGKPLDEACEKYQSCDGTVYLQYFIKDRLGKTVALTPYLTLFQDYFKIINPGGVLIAEVSRNGWDPPELNDMTKPEEERCANYDKLKTWNIKFDSNPPGIWAPSANQWPIAMMMTMLSQRDMVRKPNGEVIWSSCEFIKTTGFILSTVLLLCVCVWVPLLCFLLCSTCCQRGLQNMEEKFFPLRMNKPMKCGN